MIHRSGFVSILGRPNAGKSTLLNSLAREEMESLFGIKIYLDLHVKVESRWRENGAFLNSLDWRTMAGRDDT